MREPKIGIYVFLMNTTGPASNATKRCRAEVAATGRTKLTIRTRIDTVFFSSSFRLWHVQQIDKTVCGLDTGERGHTFLVDRFISQSLSLYILVSFFSFVSSFAWPISFSPRHRRQWCWTYIGPSIN